MSPQAAKMAEKTMNDWGKYLKATKRAKGALGSISSQISKNKATIKSLQSMNKGNLAKAKNIALKRAEGISEAFKPATIAKPVAKAVPGGLAMVAAAGAIGAYAIHSAGKKLKSDVTKYGSKTISQQDDLLKAAKRQRKKK